MSLAIVESLPCGVVSTRPCARDGREPIPSSCPTASTPSRGRNVRGRPGGGPPADHALAAESSAPEALSLSIDECQNNISTRRRRGLTLGVRRERIRSDPPRNARSPRPLGSRAPDGGPGGRAGSALVVGRGDGHEGHRGVVLIALAGLTGAHLIRERLGGGLVLLGAIEHDRLLLGVVGGGDGDVLPAAVLEDRLPGPGEAVDRTGVHDEHGGGLVSLGGGLLRGRLLSRLLRSGGLLGGGGGVRGTF